MRLHAIQYHSILIVLVFKYICSKEEVYKLMDAYLWKLIYSSSMLVVNILLFSIIFATKQLINIIHLLGSWICTEGVNRIVNFIF